MNLRRAPLDHELRVRISRRQYEALALAADWHETTISQLVRTAVRRLLEEEEEHDHQ